MIPQTMLTVFMTSIGFNRILNKNNIPFMDFYRDNLAQYFQIFIGELSAFLVLWFLKSIIS